MSERLQRVEQTWIDDTGKTRIKSFDYDETGNLTGEPGTDEQVPQGELPADFPGRDIFRRAGYGTVEAVRQLRRRGPFTRIEGIDSLTANAAEVAIATIPEDDADAAQATSADAQATALRTKVSEDGGGSDSTLPADASITVGGETAPAAGHGVEGFINGDPNNPGGSHLTTDLSVAPGATKTEAAGVGEDEEALKGKLPVHFPHKKELESAGFGTYATLRKQISKGADWYKDIPGIGEAKAKDVEEAMK